MEAFFCAARIALELKSGEIILGEITAQQIVKKAAQCDYPQSQMSRLDSVTLLSPRSLTSQ
jgi:hypothetical protein